MPGAVAIAVAPIGQGTVINTGAIVEHECEVGDFPHIAPGAVLAGYVNVGEGSLVGIGAGWPRDCASDAGRSWVPGPS